MEIKLKGREMPRGADGSVKFARLGLEHVTEDQIDDAKEQSVRDALETVLEVFTPAEVVELVNRAIYQLEYQRESHKKRGAAQRELMKATKEALEKAGVDVGAAEIKKQLEGK